VYANKQSSSGNLNKFLHKNKDAASKTGPGTGSGVGMEEGEEHVEMPVDPGGGDNGAPQSGKNYFRIYRFILMKRDDCFPSHF